MMPEEITQQMVRIVKKHQPAPHYKLFLFGSRATGKFVSQSDYDLGIEPSEKIPFAKSFQIKEDLEAIPILQKIDFVDFSRASDSFKEQAKKNMKVLYEQ